MNRPATLEMPPSTSASAPHSTIPVAAGTSVVVIGANGSGKSTLGAWLELSGPQADLAYRIGAQKSLDFPDRVSPTSVEIAERELRYGIDEKFFATLDMHNRLNAQMHMRRVHGGTDIPLKFYAKQNRWSSKPATSMLTDFKPLMALLFTEDYLLSSAYRRAATTSSPPPTPPKTILDRIQHIWEQVLPHRHLLISNGEIKAQIRDGSVTSYNASEMSDGERVTFYLIGQCLAAPADSIIIIDEPEIHLHRVIQARLWDTIEQQRPDCLIVYLTHDLSFAASRTESAKIWLKGFDGTHLDWQLVPSEQQEGLPEEVLLAVLGSRKPVLFVEGGKDSLDRSILSHIYPDWTIMPREGCEKVIEATKAFRDLKYLHGLECVGIIDRDYRSQQQQADLRAKGIYVLDIQEMENLLLVEPVLQAVAAHPHVRTMTDNTAADIVQKVKEFAFSTLQRDITSLALSKTAWELEENLHKIERQVKSVAELEKVRDKAAQFDVAGIHADFEQKLQQILTTKDYVRLLQLYNNKGLAKQVGKYFGQQSYPDLVRRLLGGGEGSAIIDALRAAAPQLPTAVAAQLVNP